MRIIWRRRPTCSRCWCAWAILPRCVSGIKTGANEFFYLEPVGLRVADVLGGKAGERVQVQNGAGWRGEIETAWLRPVIKSPRELKTLRVRPEDLRYLVLMPPKDVRDRLHDTAYLQRRYPHAWAYIQWGEERGYHKRSTCASRQRWWDIGVSSKPCMSQCITIACDELVAVHINMSVD